MSNKGNDHTYGHNQNNYEIEYADPQKEDSPPPSYDRIVNSQNKRNIVVGGKTIEEDSVVVVPISQFPTPPNGNSNNNNHNSNHIRNPSPQRRRSHFWDAITDGFAWLSCLYFLTIGMALCLFEFTWVITTLPLGIVCLLFPFVGVWFWIPFVYSWRLLGSLELICLEMCGIPFRESDPRSVGYRRPQYPPALFSRKPGSSFVGFVKDLSFDNYTVRCVIYFVFYNFIYGVLAFSIAVTLLALSPLVFFMPICANVCRQLGIWKMQAAYKMLISEDRRNFIVLEPGLV